MYAEERQQAIAELAQEQGRVAVAALARAFSVTPETIRRDLDALAGVGALERVHGGAVPSGRLRLVEAGIGARETSQAAEKDSIARAALGQLPGRSDATVLLDGGTTTSRLAALLTPGRVGTVVTNSVSIAATLSARHIAEVQLLGGRVRGVTQTTVGATTLDALRTLHVDVAFLGTNGFSPEHGFSTPDSSEAAVKRAMVSCGRRVVALADSSKAHSEYLVRFAELSDVDVLITDAGLTDPFHTILTEHGIEVVIA